MRFFLDSASLDEARKVREWGLLDGVWLSAAAVETAGQDYRRAVRELSAVTDGPVCVEPASSDAKGMYKEARELAKLGKDIVVRLPIEPDGLKVARLLAQDQIAVCVSGCYSAAPAWTWRPWSSPRRSPTTCGRAGPRRSSCRCRC